ncbi:MAG TPA: fibronectin type III domain-containing protein [Candidatus Polarisedimenticolaceae bacterium]|nr:fibronectin type III domain-containing protein [Candidatus Polarisedimenticolaceae bacterium]
MRRTCIGVLLALLLPLPPCSAAASRPPAIVLVYATAETTTSAEVVWNTDVASDSLVQYSFVDPVPADAPRIYVAAPVTVHEVPLGGLVPGALYHFKVTSCAKRGCSTATGSFETYPSCPDTVPAVAGGWENVPSPDVGGSAALDNELLGVDLVTEDEAWAVGWAQAPGAPPYVKRTLTQFFDGRSWSLVDSPNPVNDVQSVLYAVAGTSASDVWAVGSTHDGTLPSRTLIEHWDGRAWTIVASPSPDIQLNELRAVTALSENDAWAVGFRGSARPETPLETLVLHWDGASWSEVASPNVPGGANQLFAIGAISDRNLWAVGSVAGAPLALHWEGSGWSVASPGPGSGLSTEKLTGVSGTAAHDVWAVGDGRGIFSNQLFATLRHWDGKRWTERICRAGSDSNPPDGYEGGGPDAYLTGISAAAADDVWAVGVRGSGPMVLHWDGSAWTAVVHPRAYPDAAVLRAVATSRGGTAWAVGLAIEVDPSGATSPQQTRTDRYSP